MLMIKNIIATMTFPHGYQCTCVPVNWQPQKLDFFLLEQLIISLWPVPSIAFQTLLLILDARKRTLSVGKWVKTMDTNFSQQHSFRR